MENYNYSDEREIDLIDILGRIIAKWRNILIVGIIGLLIGFAISGTIGYLNMKKSDIESKKVSAKKAEALALEKLLEEDKGEDLKENADKNLVKYINIQDLYNMQEDYIENSLYTKLDSSHIAKGRLSYFVDNHYINEYPVVNAYNNIGDVMGAFTSALTSDEVCNDIISALGIKTETKYIRELISVYTTSTSNLTISVISDDEKTTDAILNYYNGIMDKVTSDVMEKYGTIDITLLDKQLYTESDMGVLSAQGGQDAVLLDYYTQLQDIEKSMSGAQKDYFDAILSKHGLEIKENKQDDHGFLYYLSKKLILLVAIAAAFLLVVFYGVIYLFDGKIKTGDELASMTGSTLLGTVLVDNEKNQKKVLFDKWAVALTDARVMCDNPENMIQVISATINQYLGANDFNSILLVGSDIKHKDIVDKLNDSIKASGYTVNTAIEAFDSAAAVNDITGSDAIVFVGEVASTKCQKLERALSMCRLYGKKVMGSIAIQERI